MTSSSIVNNARALMNILHPMTGSQRALRTLTVTANPNVQFLLQKGAWLFPVIGSPLRTRPDLLFKVLPNPDRTDGHWHITDAGTAVPIISNVAGIRHNVPVGTRFAFDFPSDDLMSMTVSAATQDATDPALNADIKDIVLFENLEPEWFVELRRSVIKDFPAVIVVFDDLSPADGTSVSAISRASRAGNGQHLYKLNYQFSIFASRGESDHIRRVEGMSILDRMLRYLSDRHESDDHDIVSNPGGVQIISAFRNAEAQQHFQKYYIYTVTLSTTVAISTIDKRTYNPWVRACIDIDKAGNPQLTLNGPLRMVTDMCIDMQAIPSNAIVDDFGIPILDDFGNFILYTG